MSDGLIKLRLQMNLNRTRQLTETLTRIRPHQLDHHLLHNILENLTLVLHDTNRILAKHHGLEVDLGLAPETRIHRLE